MTEEALPANKTKVVATIGPASESPEMLRRLIRAGLNVARLNFSHGEFSHHAEVILREMGAMTSRAALGVTPMKTPLTDCRM
jgi:pyruvate kinase